ncbi:cytochrome P450 [Elysia marginata]|uniref:Cytochrome P450 n=1 Tax=Elysia marginata TaxID=1093978 RepID=A0AAV4HSM9_9GAST|nr:cytochrome P450 [Elysia marginata]
MDAQAWKDPLKFCPERFLNKHGGIVKPDAFVPFSLGRRMCMGEALANMELFLYTTSLVKRFELQPCEMGQPPTTQFTEGIVCAPMPFQLRFVERAIY